MKKLRVSVRRMKHMGHASLIREFVGCVAMSCRSQTHDADNIRNLAMVLSAIRNARTGRRIEVKW